MKSRLSFELLFLYLPSRFFLWIYSIWALVSFLIFRFIFAKSEDFQPLFLQIFFSTPLAFSSPSEILRSWMLDPFLIVPQDTNTFDFFFFSIYSSCLDWVISVMKFICSFLIIFILLLSTFSEIIIFFSTKISLWLFLPPSLSKRSFLPKLPIH